MRVTAWGFRVVGLGIAVGLGFAYGTVVVVILALLAAACFGLAIHLDAIAEEIRAELTGAAARHPRALP